MTRIAVTGANGFVGRHVVRRGRRGRLRGGRASCAPRPRRRSCARTAAKPCEIVGRDPEALVRALDGCAAVVHLAQIGAERGGSTYEASTSASPSACSRTRATRACRGSVYFSGLGVARYGMAPRCSNPYFLSKLAAETILFRSGVEGVVFRPSYVVGPGDAFVPDGARARSRAARSRCPGDGSYRMQPIAVADAAALVLAAREPPAGRVPDGLRPRRPRAGDATRSCSSGWPRSRARLGRPAACASARSRSPRPSGARAPAATRACCPTSSTACCATRSPIPRPLDGSARTAADRRSTTRSRRRSARSTGRRFEAVAAPRAVRFWRPCASAITDHIDCAHLLPGHSQVRPAARPHLPGRGGGRRADERAAWCSTSPTSRARCARCCRATTTGTGTTSSTTRRSRTSASGSPTSSPRKLAFPFSIRVYEGHAKWAETRGEPRRGSGIEA